MDSTSAAGNRAANFVWPDPRHTASPAAQMAYARVASSANRLVRSSRWLISLVVPVTAVALGWLANRGGWISVHALTAPRTLLQAFVEAWRSGALEKNVACTLGWLLYGCFIGSFCGVLLGTAMGFSRRAEKYFFPTFKALAMIPVLVWVVLWLLVLGAGDTLKILLVAQASMMPVMLHVFGGIRNIPSEWIEVGHLLRLTPGQTLRRIIWPAALPSIWTGLRLGFTQGWLSLLAVEICVSTSGVGSVLTKARVLNELDTLIIAITAIGLLGYTLDRTLEKIGTRIFSAHTRAANLEIAAAEGRGVRTPRRHSQLQGNLT